MTCVHEMEKSSPFFCTLPITLSDSPACGSIKDFLQILLRKSNDHRQISCHNQKDLFIDFSMKDVVLHSTLLTFKYRTDHRHYLNICGPTSFTINHTLAHYTYFSVSYLSLYIPLFPIISLEVFSITKFLVVSTKTSIEFVVLTTHEKRIEFPLLTYVSTTVWVMQIFMQPKTLKTICLPKTAWHFFFNFFVNEYSFYIQLTALQIIQM
jgi:hypothetical protein